MRTLQTEGKRILSLFDLSGAWSQPYSDAGYIVHRVDLAMGVDARLLKAPDMPVHGILAAPPARSSPPPEPAGREATTTFEMA